MTRSSAPFGIADGDVEMFRKEVRANLERELDKRIARAPANRSGRPSWWMRTRIWMCRRCWWRPRANDWCALRQPDCRPRHQTPPEARSAALPVARRRVAAGLLLRDIGRSNGIRPDDKRVSQAVATIASTYEEPQKVIELYDFRSPIAGWRPQFGAGRPGGGMGCRARFGHRTDLSFDEVMRPR